MRREKENHGWCTIYTEENVLCLKHCQLSTLNLKTAGKTSVKTNFSCIFSCEDGYGGRTLITADPGTMSVVVTKLHYSGVRITASSLGYLNVRLPSSLASRILFDERSRSYQGNSVIRYLRHPNFIKDIFFTDGCRELHLQKFEVPPCPLPPFYDKLLSLLPPDCGKVYLGADGSITGFASGYKIEIPWNIRSVLLDGETGTIVSKLEDGRAVAKHIDGSMESFFPDLTHCVVHASGMAAVFDRQGMPTVEVDLQFDHDARLHSKGGVIPLIRGKDGVRMRVSCPFDGSGIFIKYDSRVGFSTRGSITVLSRDSRVIRANDSGEVSYWPSTSRGENSKLLKIDSQDICPSITLEKFDDPKSQRQHALVARFASRMQSENSVSHYFVEDSLRDTSSRYKFDLLNGTALLTDQCMNTFTVDTTGSEPMTVDLSGEIEGIKLDKPLVSSTSPHAFVLQTDGRVLHAMSTREFHKRANDTRLLSHMTEPIIPSSPVEDTRSIEHFLVYQRRDIIPGNYAFKDIFCERAWHRSCLNPPCSALASVLKSLSWSENFTIRMCLSFERFFCVEHEPFSKERYMEFESDLMRWREFCDERASSFEEFVVADFRTQEEIALEEQLRAKVKLLGKQIKQERKLAKLVANKAAAYENGKQEFKPSSNLSNIEEGVEDAVSDANFPSDVESEDDTEFIDPDALELNDAFEAFSKATETEEQNDHGKIISFWDLRAAIIQLVNYSVSVDLLKEILDLENIEYKTPNQIVSDRQQRRTSFYNELIITEEEFSRIFYRTRWILGDREEGSRFESDEMNSRSAAHSPDADMHGSVMVSDSGSMIDDERLRPKTFPIPPLKHIENENSSLSLDHPAGSGFNAAKVRMVSTT